VAALVALMLAALLALLTALTGLLARLLLSAALLLTWLTRLWIVLLLLVTIRILVLLRHFLLLGVSSSRPRQRVFSDRRSRGGAGNFSWRNCRRCMAREPRRHSIKIRKKPALVQTCL
jgi:hypothetical protein